MKMLFTAPFRCLLLIPRFASTALFFARARTVPDTPLWMARLVRKLSFDSKPSAGRTGQAPVRRNSFGSKTSRRQWSALSALADGEPSASAAAVDHHFIATADMSALGLGRVSGTCETLSHSAVDGAWRHACRQ